MYWVLVSAPILVGLVGAVFAQRAYVRGAFDAAAFRLLLAAVTAAVVGVSGIWYNGVSSLGDTDEVGFIMGHGSPALLAEGWHVGMRFSPVGASVAIVLAVAGMMIWTKHTSSLRAV